MPPPRLLQANSCYSGDEEPLERDRRIVENKSSLARGPAAGLHLKLALGGGIDPSVPAAASTGCFERLRATAMAENANDLVIKSLTSALAAAERGHDQNCADALRFAMAIRLQGLRSDTQTATERVALEAKGRQVRALQYWRLRRVVEYIDAHLADRLGLLDLAAVAGLSRMHFASQFRAATGMRPHEFLLEWRIRRAEELLRNTPTSIVEIAMIVGFQTQAHFTTVFKRLAGCTPRRWRVINRHQQGLPYSGMRRSDIN